MSHSGYEESHGNFYLYGPGTTDSWECICGTIVSLSCVTLSTFTRGTFCSTSLCRYHKGKGKGVSARHISLLTTCKWNFTLSLLSNLHSKGNTCLWNHTLIVPRWADIKIQLSDGFMWNILYVILKATTTTSLTVKGIQKPSFGETNHRIINFVSLKNLSACGS